MKALGKDIKDFWENHWPEGFYVEDEKLEYFNADGMLNVSNEIKYSTSYFGYLVDEARTGPGDRSDTFTSFFTKWYKKKTTSTIILSIPKDEEETVRIALINMFGEKAVITG